jgi:iron(III) transport system ATP-binding protein
VALARALVIKPKCLLLDEPLSNLDAKLRLEMRTEIRRICKEAELTAVYVTHDQKEALSIADRLAVLDEGKVQHCGPPQEVYLRPKSKFVTGFIGEVNFIEGVVSAIKDGQHRIKTAIGDLVSSVGPEDLVVGSPVTVSLRPEVLHFNDPPSDAGNVIDGTVHDTIYLGEVAQHQVAVGDGAVQLKAFDLNPKIFARDGAEQAKVWFRPEDVVLLQG